MSEQDTARHDLLTLLGALVDTWREILSVRVAGVALELRGACVGMAAMVGMAVAAACLAAVSWLTLLALALHWAVREGLGLGSAGLLMLACNLMAAAWLIASVRRIANAMLVRTLTNLRTDIPRHER